MIVVVDVLAAVCAVGLLGFWWMGRGVLLPLPTASAVIERDTNDDTEANDPGSSLAGFAAAGIWHEPPVEPEPIVRPALPDPELSLLGVRRSEGGFVATIRDEAAGEILRVSAGGTIAGVAVERVEARGVFGVFDGRAYALTLDGGRP